MNYGTKNFANAFNRFILVKVKVKGYLGKINLKQYKSYQSIHFGKI